MRLQGSCSGCPSSAVTLKLAVEEAIFKAAPDVSEVRAEEDAPAEPAGLALPTLKVAPGPCPAPHAAGAAGQLLRIEMGSAR